MIIKANQRGGGRQLANHLMNVQDNEHVTVHEVSGFMSESVYGAMQEAFAVSNGTRCKKYLVSVSFNPPEREEVSIKTFEDAIDRAEEKLGLKGQPRVIVFHEKEGRRHAHAAWSRIDGQAMKAIRQDFYKNRLMDLAKDLYLENDWTMPQGFIDRELRNPLNFTQDEWQQAKRGGHDPRIIKAALKNCWANSDSKKAFESALEQNGYYLARGDRRGYVALDWQGEVYSLSRWAGEKTKTLQERLGEPSKLPSVAETKANIDQKLVERVTGVIGEIRQDYQRRLAPLLAQKSRLKERHRTERLALSDKQEQRWIQEARQRHARMRKGFRGVWDRLTGKHASITQHNETEAYNAYTRDREQKEHLIQDQLQERQDLQHGMKHIGSQQESDIQDIKEKLFSNLPEDKTLELRSKFDKAAQHEVHYGPQRDDNFDLSM